MRIFEGDIILLFFHNIYCKIFTKDDYLDKISVMEMIVMSILKKEKIREIPVKNYVYMVVILLATILILFYLYDWYKTYKENELNTGIMNDYLTIINYNELGDYIMENKDAVIYVSVLGDERINKFESSFKNVIMDNELRNSILYLDITNEDRELVESRLKIDSNLPYIVVYTNGNITDIYSIADNGYSTKKIIKYFNRIGVAEID